MGSHVLNVTMSISVKIAFTFLTQRLSTLHNNITKIERERERKREERRREREREGERERVR